MAECPPISSLYMLSSGSWNQGWHAMVAVQLLQVAGRCGLAPQLQKRPLVPTFSTKV